MSKTQLEVHREIDELFEEEEVCEHCGGTGEVSAMGYVYAGEPHQADVETQTCVCRIREDDDRDDDY